MTSFRIAADRLGGNSGTFETKVWNGGPFSTAVAEGLLKRLGAPHSIQVEGYDDRIFDGLREELKRQLRLFAPPPADMVHLRREVNRLVSVAEISRAYALQESAFSEFKQRGNYAAAIETAIFAVSFANRLGPCGSWRYLLQRFVWPLIVSIGEGEKLPETLLARLQFRLANTVIESCPVTNNATSRVVAAEAMEHIFESESIEKLAARIGMYDRMEYASLCRTMVTYYTWVDPDKAEAIAEGELSDHLGSENGLEAEAQLYIGGLCSHSTAKYHLALDAGRKAFELYGQAAEKMQGAIDRIGSLADADDTSHLVKPSHQAAPLFFQIPMLIGAGIAVSDQQARVEKALSANPGLIQFQQTRWSNHVRTNSTWKDTLLQHWWNQTYDTYCRQDMSGAEAVNIITAMNGLCSATA